MTTTEVMDLALCQELEQERLEEVRELRERLARLERAMETLARRTASAELTLSLEETEARGR